MSLIADFLYPKTCYGCGRIGEYLCPECLAGVTACPVDTSPHLRPLSGVLSLFPYHSCIRNCLHGLKYSFVSDIVPDLARISSRLLSTHYPNLLSYWHSRQFIIVPIPLHPSRQNFRGFNQSALLSQHLSRELGLPYLDDLLVRSKNTTPQAFLSDTSARIANLSHAFALNPVYQHHRLSRLILFDDVVTSTSTLVSAATSLKSITFDELWGLSIAGPSPASGYSPKYSGFP